MGQLQNDRGASMAGWSDRRKFWFETVRTVFLGFVVIIVLDPEQQTTEKVAEKRIEIESTVLNDFLIADFKYTNRMYKICQKNTTAEEYSNFSDELTPNYFSSLTRIQLYFADKSLAPVAKEIVHNIGQFQGMIHNNTFGGCLKLQQELKVYNESLAQSALRSEGLAETPCNIRHVGSWSNLFQGRCQSL